MEYTKLLPAQVRRREQLPPVVVAYVVFLGLATLQGLFPNDAWINFPLHAVQVTVGSVLLLVAPGYFLLRVLAHPPERVSTHALLIGALSIVCWALVFLILYAVSALTREPMLTEPVLLSALGIVLVGLRYAAIVRRGPLYGLAQARLPQSRSVTLAITALAIAISGAHLRTVGISAGSVVLLLALIVIASIPIVLWLEEPDESASVVAIYLAAVALIFHMALISDYVWGWDVNQTFFLVSHLIETGSWSPDFFHRRTPLVSALATPLVLKQTLGLNLNWVFKIYIPLLYALIPVGIYSLSRLYLEPRQAALPPFVLMFYQRFFNTIQVKQHFGELFLVALVLVLLTDDSYNPKALLIFLGFGLVTSHYVGAFLFIAMLGLYLISLVVLKPLLPSVNQPRISISFATLIGILFAYWYMTTAQGYIFRQFVEIPAAVIIEWLTATTEPVKDRTGKALIGQTLQMGLLRQIYFAVFASILGLLGAGVLTSVVQFLRNKLKYTHSLHLILCVPPFGMFAASIVVYAHFGIDRAIPFVFIVGAPFVLVGALVVSRGGPLSLGERIDPAPAVTVLLAVFLLFNSGAVHYAFGVDDTIEPSPSPQSFALEPEKNWAVFNDQEISGALWYVNYSDKEHQTFAGNFGYISLQRYQNRYTTETWKFYTWYPNANQADLYVRNLQTDICGEISYSDACLDSPAVGSKIYANGWSRAYQK